MITRLIKKAENMGHRRLSGRRIISKLIISGTIIFVGTASLGSTQTSSSHLPGGFSSVGQSKSDLKTKETRVVSLSVNDSSVQYILRSLALQSGRSVIWDTSDPRFSKKVSVKISEEEIYDAIQIAIKNSDLIANVASDGTTIMVRAKSDSAQQKQKEDTTPIGIVIGKIVDSSTKIGIPNVTVSLVGTKLGTTSDASGSFKILSIPPGSQTISVKLLGYGSKLLPIVVKESSPTTTTIYLVPGSTTLTEVVTTATGNQRRVEVAHDIAKIDAAAVMQRSPVRTVTDLLEAAQIPGIYIQRQSGDPGSPTRIRIRGVGSISQSNDPVIILDGVWIDGSRGRPSRIDDIDPSTIESVEIVRGPSAATLYGQDASNGIIVITTKKGTVGKNRWNLEYSRDWGEVYGKKPLQYQGRGRMPASGSDRSCNISDLIRYVCVQDSVIVVDPNNPLLSTEGVETKERYAVQLDGGVNSMQYAITASSDYVVGVRRLSKIDQIRGRIQGVDVSSEFKRPSSQRRNTIGSNLTLNPSPNLALGFRMSGSQSSLEDNTFNYGWNKPEFSLDTLNLVRQTGNATTGSVQSTNYVIGSSVNWRPKSRYVLNGNFGIERFDGTDESISLSTVYNRNPIAHDSTTNIRETQRSIYTARLNASTSLPLGALDKVLSVRPSLGADYKKTSNNNFAFSNVILNSLPVIPGLALQRQTINGNRSTIDNATAGWYLNSAIGVFNRLYFDLGIRQDIGSAITSSGNTKYPKLGSSWLVSDEGFWPQNNFVSLLRLRAALGHAAVQPDVTDIYGRYVGGYGYVDGRYIPIIDQNQTGNPKLNPERATEIEVGFDTDLISDKLNLIVTYARSVNTNSLINRTMPLSAGVGMSSVRKENVGRVLNANLEISANLRAIEMRNSLLNLSYNLTLSNNKVTRLGGGVTPFSNINSGRIEEGYPIAGVWSQVVVGYIDANNDGLLSPDEIVKTDASTFLGSSQPRIRAGYGLNWTVFNSITFDSRFAYQGNYNQNLQIRNTFGSASKDASLQEQAVASINDLLGRRNVSDLRWNTASVSYFLPPSILRTLKARAINVALQGRNLGLWTNYSGRDPGVNAILLNSESIADDGNITPPPRLFVFTVRWGI